MFDNVRKVAKVFLRLSSSAHQGPAEYESCSNNEAATTTLGGGWFLVLRCHPSKSS